MPATELDSVREAVEAAKKRPPVADDAKFLALKGSEVGSPALVYTPEGEPAFWIVPLLVENAACGFARVGLARSISQIGIFGSSPQDRLSWIDATFFEKPSPEILAEIGTRYPGSTMSKPVLSYDRSPHKWAWKVEIRKGDEIEATIFITPGGWYEAQLDRKPPEWEG